jgi:hypothetical protein
MYIDLQNVFMILTIYNIHVIFIFYLHHYSHSLYIASISHPYRSIPIGQVMVGIRIPMGGGDQDTYFQ